jgi:hypothetical protein
LKLGTKNHVWIRIVLAVRQITRAASSRDPQS